MNTTVGILIILGAGYLLFSGSLDSLTGGTGDIGGGLSPSPVYTDKGIAITDVELPQEYSPYKQNIIEDATPPQIVLTGETFTPSQGVEAFKRSYSARSGLPFGQFERGLVPETRTAEKMAKDYYARVREYETRTGSSGTSGSGKGRIIKKGTSEGGEGSTITRY